MWFWSGRGSPWDWSASKRDMPAEAGTPVASTYSTWRCAAQEGEGFGAVVARERVVGNVIGDEGGAELGQAGAGCCWDIDVKRVRAGAKLDALRFQRLIVFRHV